MSTVEDVPLCDGGNALLAFPTLLMASPNRRAPAPRRVARIGRPFGAALLASLVACAPTAAPSATCGDASPAPYTAPRRLTNDEYGASLVDVLGVPASVLDGVRLPDDPRVEGMIGNADATALSPVLLDRYFAAAEALRAALLDDRARLVSLVRCATPDDVCTRAFVRRVGRRLYRRPLTDAEIGRMVALAHVQGGGPEPLAGPLAALEAMLVSPSFLLRMEGGVSCGDSAKLDGYAMAARLSFLLLGVPPSDALLDAAAARALDTADGVEHAARALLADPRARTALTRFFDQWLQLDQFSFRRPDDNSPGWNIEVRGSMPEEAHRLLDDYVWRDGADFLDVLTARDGYLDPALATYYAVPFTGTGWQHVTWPDESERGGLLTLGVVLVVTSSQSVNHAISSAIRRGLFVRESLLCQNLPPPPAGTVVLPAIMGGTDRALSELHSSDPACASCHRLLDPVGLGFERFDPGGRLQTVDALGNTLSGEGRLVGAVPEAFRGPRALAAALRATPAVARCVARQWYRWVAGRTPDADDARTIDGLAASFDASGHRFLDLVVASVRSDAFRYRRVRAAGGS